MGVFELGVLVRVALVPLNPTVGDLAGNALRMAEAVAQACAVGAELVVFPELSLCGYPPKDLLLAGTVDGFMARCNQTAAAFGMAHSEGITVVFGAPTLVDECEAVANVHALYNSLLVYRDGQRVAAYHKRLLPTYDVFDEDRYFRPGDGTGSGLIDVPSRDGSVLRVGLSICEDLWHGLDAGFAQRYVDAPDPMETLCTPGADGRRVQLVVNPSASPFALGKGAKQDAILAGHAARRNVAVAAVNQFGANDELIFDGGAAVYAAGGELLASNVRMGGEMLVVDVGANGQMKRGEEGSEGPLVRGSEGRGSGVVGDDELLFRALVLGVEDYCRKTGFGSAVLGLSGGIDSAVCAVLACASHEPGTVIGASMPSWYS